MESTLQYHWQRLNLSTLPPPHRGSSLVFDRKRQQTVFVAGGTTWLWNGQIWSKVQSQNVPSARNTTHLVYDATTECVLLFGGIGVDGTPLNDLWLWDGVRWMEQHPPARPSPVGGAGIACHVVNQQVIVFGGITGFDGRNGSNRVGTLSNETWLWDGSTWTEQPTRGAPPARMGGQMVYDEARAQTLLFGGIGSTGYLNDMWLWNGTAWSQLHPDILPPARARYQAIFHEQLQQVVLLGETIEGSNQSQRSYQIWLWDGTSWSRYSTDAVMPGSVEGLAYDSIRDATIACVVAGGKEVLPTKRTGTGLPELAASILTAQTWIWE